MFRLFRRGAPLALLFAIVAVMSQTWQTPPASAQTADSSSVFSTQSASSATDWQSAIPSVYLSGYPVQWTSVVTEGVRWTPTVIRIQRNGHYFAFFATPNGRLWAGSEDDGTLWKVDNYYDNNSWSLASLADAESNGIWLAHFIEVLFWIVVVAALLFMVALLIFVIWNIPRKGGGKGFKASENQLNTGMWAGDTSGFTWRYYADPDFRSGLNQYPGVQTQGQQLGLWTMP